MGEVQCLVGRAELLVGLLWVSVLMVDIAGVVKLIRVTSGFVFQVIVVGSIGVSGSCILQVSCGT